MAITTADRAQIIAEAAKRLENTISHQMTDWSLAEGPMHNLVMGVIPHVKWHQAPNPIYSHWELHNLSEEQRAHPVLQAIGEVKKAPEAFGKHYEIVPSTPPENRYDYTWFDCVRTPEQQRAWKAYWAARDEFQRMTEGRKKAYAELLEALQALS